MAVPPVGHARASNVDSLLVCLHLGKLVLKLGMSPNHISALTAICGSFSINIYLENIIDSLIKPSFYRVLICGSHCQSSHTLFCLSWHCNKVQLEPYCTTDEKHAAAQLLWCVQC